MVKGIRYTDEFKQEAVNQITKHSYDVAEVSTRLGVSNSMGSAPIDFFDPLDFAPFIFGAMAAYRQP